MTLKQAQQLPGVTSATKVDNNTFRLEYENGDIAIRLHNTNIITFFPDGSTQVTTGGWKVPTTKDRINKFAAPVYSKKGIWYITVFGKDYEFFDGMIFKEDEVINTPEIVKQEEANEATAGFKSIAMVAMFGNLFCNTPKETNDWKSRMIKAGLGEGIQMPDDWDELSEDEKQRRLDGVIQVLSN